MKWPVIISKLSSNRNSTRPVIFHKLKKQAVNHNDVFLLKRNEIANTSFDRPWRLNVGQLVVGQIFVLAKYQ